MSSDVSSVDSQNAFVRINNLQTWHRANMHWCFKWRAEQTAEFSSGWIHVSSEWAHSEESSLEKCEIKKTDGRKRGREEGGSESCSSFCSHKCLVLKEHCVSWGAAYNQSHCSLCCDSGCVSVKLDNDSVLLSASSHCTKMEGPVHRDRPLLLHLGGKTHATCPITSHRKNLTCFNGDIWAMLQPNSRGRSQCFGFTFGKLSCRPPSHWALWSVCQQRYYQHNALKFTQLWMLLWTTVIKDNVGKNILNSGQSTFILKQFGKKLAVWKSVRHKSRFCAKQLFWGKRFALNQSKSNDQHKGAAPPQLDDMTTKFMFLCTAEDHCSEREIKFSLPSPMILWCWQQSDKVLQCWIHVEVMHLWNKPLPLPRPPFASLPAQSTGCPQTVRLSPQRSSTLMLRGSHSL